MESACRRAARSSVPGFSGRMRRESFNTRPNPIHLTWVESRTGGVMCLRAQTAGNLAEISPSCGPEYRVMKALARTISVPKVFALSGEQARLWTMISSWKLVEAGFWDPGCRKVSKQAANPRFMMAWEWMFWAGFHRSIGSSGTGWLWPFRQYFARQIRRWQPSNICQQDGRKNCRMDRLMDGYGKILPDDDGSLRLAWDYGSTHIFSLAWRGRGWH